MTLRGILLVLVLACSPCAAFAQDTGSILNGKEPARIEKDSKVTGSEARAIIEDYATCLVKRRYNPVKKALAYASESHEQRKALISLSQKECLANGELRFDVGFIRTSLYKALVRRDFSRSQVVFDETPIDYLADSAKVSGPAYVASYASLLQFADCVVRRNPQVVQQLLLSQAGSGQENAALNSIYPELGKCVGATSQLTFGKVTLIGLLAEVFYREAEASQTKSAG